MSTAKLFSQETERWFRPYAWMILRTARAAVPWSWSLHWAAESGNVNMVRDLLRQQRYSVNCASQNSGWTPLHYACDKGNASLVEVLVSEFHADPSLLDHSGCTPVYYACEKGHLNVIRVLVSKFKSVLQAAWDSDGHTILMLAALFGHNDMLHILLEEYRCPVADKDWNGWCVLHHACAKGDTGLVETLIREYKADVGALNHDMDTPLHVATELGHFELVCSLITTFGCDPSTPGHLGRTPLHIASQNGHISLVQTLLKSTSPLVADESGYTPLHLAAEANKLDCVRALLHANASPLVRNCSARTPIDLASGISQHVLKKYVQVHKDRLKIDYNAFFEQAKKKYSGSHHLTRMFVLGYPGAGKSSLIESLKREGFFESFLRVSESSVPLHTAGIIPSVHFNKQYGRVLFYDFAGDAEYYSSHAAFFENMASSKKGNNIFVVVVDLRDDDATIFSTLHYWWAFIRYQKFRELSLVLIGSHVDSSTKHKGMLLGQFCATVSSDIHRVKHFMLDCRDPRSQELVRFKKQMCEWACKSLKYKISQEASILLGLLERDFGAVTACPVQTLLSHVKNSGVWFPEKIYQILLELHEVGVLLLLGDSASETGCVILNVSKLTNEVHKLLFSTTAAFHILRSCNTRELCLQTNSLNIGIVPEDILAEILPSHITKECLIHLQYCQKICRNVFRQIDFESSSRSFLFFPALCNVERSQAFWSEPTSTTFSIGWLAVCTDPYDYFPPRFLHVLLLRLVYSFTLSVPAQLQAAHTSPEHSRRCTMWKRGVHWKMEEGVECMVELVDGSKGVMVLLRCSVDSVEDTCASIFMRVVNCVMEAKAEFCHSIKPQFFLIDSSAEADCLSEDHLFAMSDVERALESPKGKKVIVSISGKGVLELSKLQCMRRLAHWNSLFPLEFSEVLDTLKTVVHHLFNLGLSLGAPLEFLESLEENFPTNVDRRRRELVKWWIHFSPDPPCWWTLAEALKDIDRSVHASEIRNKHGADMDLQEKIWSCQHHSKKPSEEFLHSLSGVVGSRWPSLAVSLAVSEEEIAKLKKRTGLSPQKRALCMLKIWALRDNATYGQLNHKLRAVSLH